MSRSLDQRRVLITGASKGVGRAIAEAMAAHNMHIGLLARSESLLEEVALAVRSRGSQAYVLEADLRDYEACKKVVRSFEEVSGGGVDFLVNNAGIGARGFWKDLRYETEQDIMRVNYLAPVFLIRLLLPTMLDQGRGHIININSAAGLYSSPYLGAYCASKSALMAYSSSLSYELQSTSVRLTNICPGPIQTEFLDGPNFENFKKAPDLVTPECIADIVFSVIDKPRETVVVGTWVRRLALKVATMAPQFFRGIIEKKNKPPASISSPGDPVSEGT